MCQSQFSFLFLVKRKILLNKLIVYKHQRGACQLQKDTPYISEDHNFLCRTIVKKCVGTKLIGLRVLVDQNSKGKF